MKVSRLRGRRRTFTIAVLLTTAVGPAVAASEANEAAHDMFKMDHSSMDHSSMPGMKQSQKPKSQKAQKPRKKSSLPASHHAGHGMDHDMKGHGGMQMKGVFGPYTMTREASGTSWQPDTSPHEGIHQQFADWSVMTHGWMNLNYDRQDGPRGANKTFGSGMVMVMAQRPVGEGTFGLRGMLSPEPFFGANGYPLLLATGETADGRTHLVDRQHPHDLFMEMAATYSHPITGSSSWFVYGGLPGEPALGPPAFMHRTSGMDNPEAPISHHWLDSTHITFGVITTGLVLNNWKIEGSAFRGREPDQFRFDIERPKLDSFAGRVSWNPIRELSMQVSYGQITSPEQLEPDVNERRLTASAIYTVPFGDGNLWSTTAAFGRKMMRPDTALDAYLLESSLIWRRNWTTFMRAERVNENELTHDVPGLDGRTFTVGKVSVGGIYDFFRTDRAKFGIGGLVSRYVLPGELKDLYGRDLTSFMIFGRVKII